MECRHKGSQQTIAKSAPFTDSGKVLDQIHPVRDRWDHFFCSFINKENDRYFKDQTLHSARLYLCTTEISLNEQRQEEPASRK